MTPNAVAAEGMRFVWNPRTGRLTPARGRKKPL
jgi:hypothetical protein